MKNYFRVLEQYMLAILENTNKLLEQNLQLFEIVEGQGKNEVENKEVFDENRASVLYAYRYLLNREPEDSRIVTDNMKSWRELRENILHSTEYKLLANDKRERNKYINDIYTAQKNISELIKNVALPDYEAILEQSYTKLIGKGDTVIDIGAHKGRHSKVFCKLVGENGHLYAFEPLPEQFAYLEQELGNHNVTIINKALSNEVGVMDFYVVENYLEESGLRKRIYNSDDAKVEKIQVNVEMLDNYIKEFKDINYIKLDAEGAEINILSGAKKCIERFRPVISIEYGYPSYSVYGLKYDSLYNFTLESGYYITDIYGNVVLNNDIWRDVCDSVYWDYFLVPHEKIKEFLLKIHA